MDKALYLDCSAGAAGDMLLGALYSILSPKVEFLKELSCVPQVKITPCTVTEFGITGHHMAVKIQGLEERNHLHHHHDSRSLSDVLRIIQDFSLPKVVIEHACTVYQLVADAESKAHQTPVGSIHFHEVGMLDAIADIVGVCYAIHLLQPTEILATAVALGSGTISCAHGILPVPAPATAFLLEGIPTVEGPVTGELCTPTGAALLRHFVTHFGAEMPQSTPHGGFGTKRFPTHPNAVLAYTFNSSFSTVAL